LIVDRVRDHIVRVKELAVDVLHTSRHTLVEDEPEVPAEQESGGSSFITRRASTISLEANLLPVRLLRRNRKLQSRVFVVLQEVIAQTRGVAPLSTPAALTVMAVIFTLQELAVLCKATLQACLAIREARLLLLDSD